MRCTPSAFLQGNKRYQLPSPGGLPALGFDSALQLVNLNQRALEVFFDRQELNVPSNVDAEWFLGAGSDVRARLVLLAEKSQTTWGEGPTLQLWKSASLEDGSRASFHAEVLVDDFTSSAETDLAFSLILLRPASPSRSAERPHSPTRTYSSSFTLAPPPTFGPVKPPPRRLSKSAHLVPALSKWKDEGVHTSTEELYRTLKIVTARVSAPLDTSAESFTQSPVASVEGGDNDTLMADGPTDPPAGYPASSAGQQQDDGLGDKGQRKLSFEELNRLMDTLPVVSDSDEVTLHFTDHLAPADRLHERGKRSGRLVQQGCRSRLALSCLRLTDTVSPRRMVSLHWTRPCRIDGLRELGESRRRLNLGVD